MLSPSRHACRLSIVALCAGASLAAGVQQQGAVDVQTLRFAGNHVVSDAELRTVCLTRASGFFPWSPRHPFDRRIFDADLDRIVALYRIRGYPEARVVPDIAFTDDGDAVDVTLAIEEGAPTLLERIDFEGLSDLPQDLADRLRDVPLRVSVPFDRRRLSEAAEAMGFLLRDHGYPTARVTPIEQPGSAERLVVVRFVSAPGPPLTFGPVEFVGLEHVSPAVIRRSLAFRVGDLYRESLVLESQRRLSALGLFDFAHVTRRPAETPPEPGAGVPMVTTVKEGKPTRLELGIGFGSEDGPRGWLEWSHRNFLGAARQVRANTKYSRRLSGIGLDFIQPYVATRQASLSAQTGAWWTNEPTYTSRSVGVRLGLSRRWQWRAGVDGGTVDQVLRGTYVLEELRYTIDSDARDLTTAAELIALGIDPISGSGDGRVGALDVDLERAALDNALDPHSGYAVSAHLEHAAPWLRGTFRYDEVQTEARAFLPLGPAIVLASRVRGGVLIAADDEQVPFSSRYFLGGTAGMRGWGRFEVAPLTGDGLPIGGRGVVELSTELRAPLAGALGLVWFVDAGNVWPAPADISLGELNVAVGPGVRWKTPFGIIRADVGYQLTPITGLLVNGVPEDRRWRVHLSFGQAF